MNNDYNNQQPQFPQPGPPIQQPGQQQATVALVLSIISLLTFWASWGALIGVGTGIAAIVLASNAKKKGFVGGMATAALVMGIIGTLLSSVFFIACTVCVCIVMAATPDLYDQVASMYSIINPMIF